MARIRPNLGLMVYPVGYGGNYNPSVDPIAPMVSPPITYDMINGRRTTNSPIQQTLRYNYPVDWSGGIGRISRIPRAALGRDALGSIGQTTIGTMTTAASGTNTVTPTPVTTPITGTDTSSLPLTTSSYNLETELTDNQLLGTTPVSSSQLSSVITQGTNSGLTASQISAIVAAASNAGVSVLKATASPYTIPGTSLVYNPATGQITSATGLTSTALAAESITSSLVPMILLGVGALFLVMMMER